MMDQWKPIYDKWSGRFLELASTVATWSKDPSSQVGCVLVDDLNRVVSLGYNGFPRGIDDTEYRLSERKVKYDLTVHAEMNAVLNCPLPTRGLTAYVTHPPCSRCMVCLVQAGIKRVVTFPASDEFVERWRDSLLLTSAIAAEAGIELLIREPNKKASGLRTSTA